MTPTPPESSTDPQDKHDTIIGLLQQHRHDYFDYCKNLIDSEEFDRREQAVVQELDLYTQSRVREAVLKEVREDRLANAKFWKGKIDKMLDQEIAVYEAQLNQPRKDNNETRITN